MFAFVGGGPGIQAGRAAVAAGYSCTMTAGNLADVLFGYDTGDFSGSAFGSIDAEPIPGQSFIGLFYDPGSFTGVNGSVAFAGNITGLLSGLTIWVASTQYATNFSGWSFDGTNTFGSWSANSPVFVDAGVYSIEIK